MFFSQFSLTFLQTQKGCSLHYSCADWGGFGDNLRGVLWEDIFKLGATAAGTKFCEWVQVGINVYISHDKYYVKPF